MASPPYVELHAHSAFSFLDGASAPDEMAAAGGRAGARGPGDHGPRRPVRIARAFAHAARAAGVRPITGAEVTLRGRRPPDAAGRGRARVRQPLPAHHPGPRGHPPAARPPRAAPGPRPRRPGGPRRGAGVPHRLRARRAWCRAWWRAGGAGRPRRRCATWCATSGADNVFVEIQHPRSRGDRRLARDLAAAGRERRRAVRGDGRPPRPLPRARAAAGRLRGDPPPADPRRLRGRAARQPRRGAALRRARWRRCSPTTRRPWPRPRAWPSGCEFDLTRDLGYRFPDFARIASRRDGPGRAGAHLRATSSARATPTPASGRPPGCAWTRSSRSSPTTTWPASSCCTATSWSWRARWPCAVRPAGLGPPLAAARAGARVLGGLDRLLPHRPLPHRPGRERPLPGPVPQPRHGLGARHRPRLPARRARARSSRPSSPATAPSTPPWWRPSPPSASAWPSASWAAPWPCPRPTWSGWCGCPTHWSSAGAVEEELARLPDGEAKLASPRWRALAFLAREAAGLPRHLSQHSGGMVVSARPLVELVPVVPAAFPGRQICQWDKDSCADAGFVKIDLLGLGMLSAVEECVDLIARSRAARASTCRASASPTRRSTPRSRTPTRSGCSRSRAGPRCRACCRPGPRASTTSPSRWPSSAPGRSAAGRCTPT